MEQLFAGSVGLKIEGVVRGAWALPTWDSVSVGRLPSSGLHIPEEWVPSRLCRFIPYERGWVVQLGRPRAEVLSKYISNHTFNSRAIVALQAGRARLQFPELDDELVLVVKIGADVADGLEVLEDRREEERVGRTAYAAAAVDIPLSHRRVLAVTFLHLMTRQQKPPNLALAAANVLGKSEQSVKNVLTTTRQKVNRERWLDLKDAEHLGHYLVRLTRTITLDDLPPGIAGTLPG